MPLLSFIIGHKPSTRRRSRTTNPSQVQKTSLRTGSINTPASGSSKRVRGSGPSQDSRPLPTPIGHGSESSLTSSVTSFISTASESGSTGGINFFTTKNVANVPLPEELNLNNASLGQEWMEIGDASDRNSFTSAHHEPSEQDVPHNIDPQASKVSKKVSQESMILVEEPDSPMFQLKQQLKATQISLSEAQNQCATLNDRIQIQEEKIKSQEALLAAATLSWNTDKISTTRVFAKEMENKDKEMMEVKKELEVALLDSKAKPRRIEELTLDSRALEVEVNHVRKVLVGRDKEIIVVRAELNEVKSKLVDSNEYSEKLTEERAGLVAGSNALRVQLESVQATVEERDANIARMRQDEIEKMKHIALIGEEKETLRQQLESVQASVEERDANIARMQKDEADKVKAITGLKEEKQVLHRELESIEARLKRRDSTIKFLTEKEEERNKLEQACIREGDTKLSSPQPGQEDVYVSSDWFSNAKKQRGGSKRNT